MNKYVKKVLYGLGFAAQKAVAIVVGKVATDQCYKRGMSLDNSVLVGATVAVATDTALKVVSDKVVDYIEDKELENELDIEDFDYGDLSDEEFDAMYEKYLKDNGYTEDGIAKSFEDLVFGADEDDDDEEDVYEEVDAAEELDEVPKPIEEAAEAVEAVAEEVADSVSDAINTVKEPLDDVQVSSTVAIENVVDADGNIDQVAVPKKTPVKKKKAPAKKAE